MSATVLTPNEIRVRGFEALLRELGAAGAVRFIQQYESGRGDYTRNRRTWLPHQSVRELAQAVQKQDAEKG